MGFNIGSLATGILPQIEAKVTGGNPLAAAGFGLLGALATSSQNNDALAESPAEQSSVNALSSFAGLQIPPPAANTSQQPDYSYRKMAGLDDNGNSKTTGSLAGIVDGDASSSGDPLADSIS